MMLLLFSWAAGYIYARLAYRTRTTDHFMQEFLLLFSFVAFLFGIWAAGPFLIVFIAYATGALAGLRHGPPPG